MLLDHASRNKLVLSNDGRNAKLDWQDLADKTIAQLSSLFVGDHVDRASTELFLKLNPETVSQCFSAIDSYS